MALSGVLAPDASQVLAMAYNRPQSALADPQPLDPCDRCRRALGSRIARLGRGDYGGVEATWWICAVCDADLTEWWYQPYSRRPLGGT